MTDAPTLEASITIDAPPRAVWAVVSDLRRMGEWSPQCRRMLVLGRVRKGARVVNLNRQGLLVWPTTARIVRYEPQRAIAFQIPQNGTVWTYELEPAEGGACTMVTERREAPRGLTTLSRALISAFLGGHLAFTARQRRGMDDTLARIKSEVETPEAEGVRR